MKDPETSQAAGGGDGGLARGHSRRLAQGVLPKPVHREIEGAIMATNATSWQTVQADKRPAWQEDATIRSFHRKWQGEGDH